MLCFIHTIYLKKWLTQPCKCSTALSIIFPPSKKTLLASVFVSTENTGTPFFKVDFLPISVKFPEVKLCARKFFH